MTSENKEQKVVPISGVDIKFWPAKKIIDHEWQITGWWCTVFSVGEDIHTAFHNGTRTPSVDEVKQSLFEKRVYGTEARELGSLYKPKDTFEFYLIHDDAYLKSTSHRHAKGLSVKSKPVVEMHINMDWITTNANQIKKNDNSSSFIIEPFAGFQTNMVQYEFATFRGHYYNPVDMRARSSCAIL